MIVDWARTQTVPETGDQTCRLHTSPNPGGQRNSSSPMACQQEPDKEPGNKHRSGATEVGQLRKKPQVSRASSQHGKREGRTQGRAQEKPGARTIQPPEMGVEEEAKASGMCARASEETKTRSRRSSHQRVTKNHPNSRKRRWTIRHWKRMKNHEGQPKPPS